MPMLSPEELARRSPEYQKGYRHGYADSGMDDFDEGYRAGLADAGHLKAAPVHGPVFHPQCPVCDTPGKPHEVEWTCPRCRALWWTYPDGVRPSRQYSKVDELLDDVDLEPPR